MVLAQDLTHHLILLLYAAADPRLIRAAGNEGVLSVEGWAEIRRLHRAEGMPIKVTRGGWVSIIAAATTPLPSAAPIAGSQQRGLVDVGPADIHLMCFLKKGDAV